MGSVTFTGTSVRMVTIARRLELMMSKFIIPSKVTTTTTHLHRSFSSLLSSSPFPGCSTFGPKESLSTFDPFGISTKNEQSLYRSLKFHVGSTNGDGSGESSKSPFLHHQRRWMSSSSGSKPQGNSKATNQDQKTDDKTAFLQHQEWVKFQQSISVDGFETGQVTTAKAKNQSTRGGVRARKKKEKEQMRLGAFNKAGGPHGRISPMATKFPAIQYSPEETEALLKEAYATLPVRTGKRGTRNLKRQANRWRAVRKIRSDYKKQILEAHFRRMEHRKYKRERTKEAKYDAVDQRKKDAEYQGKILRRWKERFYNISYDAEGDSATIQEGH